MTDPQTSPLFPADGNEPIAEDATLLRAFAAAEAADLVRAVETIATAAPLRNMITPGGARMAVAMTSCGRVGWITDRRGYRYSEVDPVSSRPWPPMPPSFSELAARAAAAAGYAAFEPDACLINRYRPGTRLSLHQDRDERDFTAPVVSISLGLPVVFLFGGLRRTQRPLRVVLESGDVVVWGGEARLAFHGTAPLAVGHHALTGSCRINLTFRKAL